MPVSLLLVAALFHPPTGAAKAEGDKPAAAPASAPSSQPTNPDFAASADEKGVVRRGGSFQLKEETTLAAIAESPDTFTGKPVKVRGKIAQVCQAKGCWLTLAHGEDGPSARITFKDYAFFSPKDAKGHPAVVEGLVEVKKMSDGERAHLAEDAKRPVSEIPKVELRIVASALEILPR